MRAHWQRKHHLVRQALPDFQGVVTPKEVLTLATRDEAQARLIIREGKTWHVEHGPFSAKALKSLPAKNWTILVQGLNALVPEADALMRQFAFIPYARLDDVMVSLAAPGGGVGPHFDSYDVFLLQGQGRRRWKISTQSDLTLRANTPLKILKNFSAEDEWTLAPGDMLYLPPRNAHDGIAIDTCLTFSIGFRAPSAQEIIVSGLEAIVDDQRALAVMQSRLSTDRRLTATTSPAHIPTQYADAFERTLNQMKWARADAEKLAGIYASTPKSNVFFDAPDPTISLAQFTKKIITSTLMFDANTIALYDSNAIYINGEVHLNPTLLRNFLDTRTRPPARSFNANETQLLYEWFCCGWVIFQ